MRPGDLCLIAGRTGQVNWGWSQARELRAWTRRVTFETLDTSRVNEHRRRLCNAAISAGVAFFAIASGQIIDFLCDNGQIRGFLANRLFGEWLS